MTRREYAKAYERYQRQIEAKYTLSVFRALQRQIRPFIQFISLNPNAENLPPLRVDMTPVRQVIERLYRVEVPRYANMTTDYLNRNVRQKAFGLNQYWLERVAEYLRQYGGTLITSITETTSKYIEQYVQEVIEQSRREGLSVSETVRLLRDKFKKTNEARARRIARTETNSALNFAGKTAAERSGLQLQKVWLATADFRTRDTHRHLNGVKVGMDQPFTTTGNNGQQVELMYPGDPAARNPENTVNCRCTLIYEPLRDPNGNLL